MGFQTPLYELSEYLDWTTEGRIQLPDFQRGYKWEEERIRSLLVTVLRGHPLGVVMLLKTGNDTIRFKPRPIEGTQVDYSAVKPDLLLLDGQQRLTSLTQALTGKGVVHTMDSRGKLLDRRYLRRHGNWPCRVRTASTRRSGLCPATGSCARTSARTSSWICPRRRPRAGATAPSRCVCIFAATTCHWLFAMDGQGPGEHLPQADVIKPTGDVQHPGHRAGQRPRASPRWPPCSRRSTPAGCPSTCSNC